MGPLPSPADFNWTSLQTHLSDFNQSSAVLKKINFLKSISSDFDPAAYRDSLVPNDPRLEPLRQSFKESSRGNFKIWKVCQLARQLNQEVFEEDSDSVRLGLEEDFETNPTECEVFVASQSSATTQRAYIFLAAKEYLSLKAIDFAKAGDLPKLEEWVQKDRNRLLMKTKEGENLAYVACAGRQLLVLDWLYHQDPDLIKWVRKDGKSLCFLAALEGEKEMINWLLNKGISYSPWQFALDIFKFYPSYSNEKICQLLESMGWFIQSRSLDLLLLIFKNLIVGSASFIERNFSKSGDYYRKVLIDLERINQMGSVDGEVSHNLLIQARIGMDLACHEKGKSYLDGGDFLKAIDCFKESIHLRETLHGECDPCLIDALAFLNLAYSKEGNSDEMIKCLTRSIQIIRELPERKALLACNLNELGLLYLKKEDFDRAIECFSEAVKQPESDQVRTFSNLGLAYFKKGLNDKAIQFFNESHRRRICSENLDELYVLLNQIYLSSAYYRKGCQSFLEENSTQALDYFKTSVFFKKRINEALPENLSPQQNGRNEKIVCFFKNVVQENKKSLIEIASHFVELGSKWETSGEIDKAIECFRESLQIRLDSERGESGGRVSLGLIDNFKKLGDAYLNRVDPNKAFACFQEFLDLAKKLHEKQDGMHPDLAEVQQKLDRIRSTRVKVAPFKENLENRRIFRVLSKIYYLFWSVIEKVTGFFLELGRAFFRLNENVLTSGVAFLELCRFWKWSLPRLLNQER